MNFWQSFFSFHTVKLLLFITILYLVIYDSFSLTPIMPDISARADFKHYRVVKERTERDAKRLADLQRIQLALERYIKDHGEPPTPKSYQEQDWLNYDTSTDGEFLRFLKPDYLLEVPRDPINEDTGKKTKEEGAEVKYGYFYAYFQGDSKWGEKERDKHFYVLGTFLESGQSQAFLNHEVGYFVGRVLEP
ncbi:MAG: hypothetical protein HZB70_03300 [Candidatus Berkelbacteria bacterium]|nr:MAG: hypothetical protein HZB70_03300 [Candidatus Berkelbacteria bacterium]QQG51672.1 MAG: hypothetical protein HY845_03890 [Candidatus Berkelbacteria bacterium]